MRFDLTREKPRKISDRNRFFLRPGLIGSTGAHKARVHFFRDYLSQKHGVGQPVLEQFIGFGLDTARTHRITGYFPWTFSPMFSCWFRTPDAFLQTMLLAKAQGTYSKTRGSWSEMNFMFLWMNTLYIKFSSQRLPSQILSHKSQPGDIFRAPLPSRSPLPVCGYHELDLVRNFEYGRAAGGRAGQKPSDM